VAAVFYVHQGLVPGKEVIPDAMIIVNVAQVKDAAVLAIVN